jgi:predicted nucleic acid-binding protein
MKRVFADTFYWIALINKSDSWYQRVKSYSVNLENIEIITTEEVLTETINFFASFPTPMRTAVSQLVVQIIQDHNIQVIPQTHESFLAGLELFQQRFDKGYSLTDCISMITMKNLNIIDILTHDKHFTQEGFLILFKD